MRYLPRNVAELWNHHRAGGAQELTVAIACMADALELSIVLLDTLAALKAEVNKAFGATVSVSVEPPATSRTFGLRANAFVRIGHDVLFGYLQAAVEKELAKQQQETNAA